MKHIISDFNPLGGKHCISASIKQIFKYNQLEISEEMIFGLASALNFLYFDFKNSPYPFIGGRNKLIEFEDNLSQALNITVDVQETSSSRKAYRELKKMIEEDCPVMIYVDMGELPYLGLPEGYHFGGHSVVVFGLDEEEGVAYLSDRDSKGYRISDDHGQEPADYHLIKLDELERARGSKEKPYPPKNRWLIFDLKWMKSINSKVIKRAIIKNMESLLNPPIRNLGVRGIETLAERLISDWKNYSEDKLRASAFNTYIFINEKGGTGGGIFRKMYGDFLIESSAICELEELQEYGETLKEIGDQWDIIGYQFYDLFESGRIELLDEISAGVRRLHRKEGELYQEISELLLLLD